MCKIEYFLQGPMKFFTNLYFFIFYQRFWGLVFYSLYHKYKIQARCGVDKLSSCAGPHKNIHI